MAMKFGGVDYKRGDVLPVERMSKHKHWELWTCGKADHLSRGPFDKRKAAAATVPALDPDPVTESEVESEASDSMENAPTTTEGIEPVLEQSTAVEPVGSVGEVPVEDLTDDDLERLTRPE
jgi:hypothetical protein